MEQLLEYIRKFGQLDLREENLIRQAFEKKSIPKASYFVACGKVNNSIAFVESGVFRSLYYNSKATILHVILSMKVVLLATFRASWIEHLPMTI